MKTKTKFHKKALSVVLSLILADSFTLQTVCAASDIFKPTIKTTTPPAITINPVKAGYINLESKYNSLKNQVNFGSYNNKMLQQLTSFENQVFDFRAKHTDYEKKLSRMIGEISYLKAIVIGRMQDKQRAETFDEFANNLAGNLGVDLSKLLSTDINKEKFTDEGAINITGIGKLSPITRSRVIKQIAGASNFKEGLKKPFEAFLTDEVSRKGEQTTLTPKGKYWELKRTSKGRTYKFAIMPSEMIFYNKNKPEKILALNKINNNTLTPIEKYMGKNTKIRTNTEPVDNLLVKAIFGNLLGRRDYEWHTTYHKNPQTGKWEEGETLIGDYKDVTTYKPLKIIDPFPTLGQAATSFAWGTALYAYGEMVQDEKTKSNGFSHIVHNSLTQKIWSLMPKGTENEVAKALGSDPTKSLPYILQNTKNETTKIVIKTAYTLMTLGLIVAVMMATVRNGGGLSKKKPSPVQTPDTTQLKWDVVVDHYTKQLKAIEGSTDPETLSLVKNLLKNPNCAQGYANNPQKAIGVFNSLIKALYSTYNWRMRMRQLPSLELKPALL